MASRTTMPAHPVEPGLAAIVQIDLFMLRALLQLPADAEIDHTWQHPDRPTVLNLRVVNAGFQVAQDQLIPVDGHRELLDPRRGQSRSLGRRGGRLPHHDGPREQEGCEEGDELRTVCRLGLHGAPGGRTETQG